MGGWVPVECEVEVGLFGSWAHFSTIGKRGRRVIDKNSAATGYVLTIRIRSRDKGPAEKAYDYTAKPWQDFAAVCAGQHVTRAIMESVPADAREQAAKVVGVHDLATHAIYPMRTATRLQSASGLEVHLLITGVRFDPAEEGDEASYIACPPLPLLGQFPSGRLTDGGKRPLTTQTQVYFVMRDLASAPRVHDLF